MMTTTYVLLCWLQLKKMNRNRRGNITYLEMYRNKKKAENSKIADKKLCDRQFRVQQNFTMLSGL